ncbi:MAG TPA: hypothetical protein VMS86_14775 [Thermoanaerobaculia bacterium]|nr:hypothetical protein [Thermoanaerobaculia bacterium]
MSELATSGARLPGEAVVEQALRKQALAVTRQGRTRWRFALANGRSFAVSARLAADWLLLQSAPFDWPAAAGLWPLLQLDARLAGPGKVALASGRPRLAAELPVEEGVDLGVRLAEACADFRRAAAILEGETGAGEPAGSGAPEVATEGPAAPEPSALPRLLGEAGWSAGERAPRRWAVDLDTPGSFHQALVEEDAAGSVRLAAELAVTPALGAAGLRALAWLLLEANGCVRLARAAAGEQAASARFEVRFASPPVAEELGHALASLSVACRDFAREARALASEEVAGVYLALRNGATEAGGKEQPATNRARAR